MSRPLRIQFPGAVYHVMARGNRKSTIFEDDRDRAAFFDLLGEAADRYDFQVRGACLMSNHYHVVAHTPRGNLSDPMRFLNGVYAQASNRRHQRSGHLFGGRFRSLVIQAESYLKRVIRYVTLNPVRAGLVARAGEWAWSTYRATAGLEPAPAWLSLDWLEDAFGAATREEACERFERYVNDPAARKVKIDTNALVIGTRQFREQMAKAVRESDRPLPLGYQTIVRPELSDLLAGFYAGGPGLAAAVRAAHVRHGYHQAEIARHLRLDPSTVSKLLRRMRMAAAPTSP